jgi:hypothetical protein
MERLMTITVSILETAATVVIRPSGHHPKTTRPSRCARHVILTDRGWNPLRNAYRVKGRLGTHRYILSRRFKLLENGMNGLESQRLSAGSEQACGGSR